MQISDPGPSARCSARYLGYIRQRPVRQVSLPPVRSSQHGGHIPPFLPLLFPLRPSDAVGIDLEGMGTTPT